MDIKDFIYDGKVKIISVPRRQLSPKSEYPSLVGLEGEIVRISGNRVGILIDGRTNKDSEYGCYWFDVDCIQKVI